MNEEIMNNEEVMDEAIDVIDGVEVKGSNTGWKIAAGIGIAAITGVIIWKVGKKIAAKVKAKKELKAEAEGIEVVETEYVALEDEE